MIDVVASFCSKLAYDKIERLFQKKNVKRFFAFLYLFALVPGIIGIVYEHGNIKEIVFKNTIPNLIGASIVLSFAFHISRFHYKNFITKFLQKEYVIGTFIKIFYCACLFNSAIYSFDKNLKNANYLNNIYLFIVIFSGLIAGFVVFSGFFG